MIANLLVSPNMAVCPLLENGNREGGREERVSSNIACTCDIIIVVVFMLFCFCFVF